MHTKCKAVSVIASTQDVAAVQQILKDYRKRWLPLGRSFLRFVSDVQRVWPGPGRDGLVLLQVGVSVPIDTVTSHAFPSQLQRTFVVCMMRLDVANYRVLCSNNVHGYCAKTVR